MAYIAVLQQAKIYPPWQAAAAADRGKFEGSIAAMHEPQCMR